MKSNPSTRTFNRTLCFPSPLSDTSALLTVLAVEAKRFCLAKGRSMASKKDRGRVEIVSKPIPPKPAKPGKVKVYRALYTFEPRTPDELFFEEGDILYVSDTNDPNWWKGTCKGRTGLVPSNYVAEQAQSIDAPLQEAAKRGNVSWLRECLDNGVSINGLDKAGNTALYWAAHGGHLDIVEILLSFPNVELNHQNKLGDTSLHAAAWKGHPDVVQSLLEKGVRVDLRNNEKKYAADMATDAQSAALIKRRSGASHINNQDDEYLDEEDSD